VTALRSNDEQSDDLRQVGTSTDSVGQSGVFRLDGEPEWMLQARLKMVLELAVQFLASLQPLQRYFGKALCHLCSPHSQHVAVPLSHLPRLVQQHRNALWVTATRVRPRSGSPHGRCGSILRRFGLTRRRALRRGRDVCSGAQRFFRRGLDSGAGGSILGAWVRAVCGGTAGCGPSGENGVPGVVCVVSGKLSYAL